MATRGIKDKKFLILGFIFLLSFALLTVNIKHSKGPIFLENFIALIFSPFQAAFTQTVNGISSVVDHYFLLVNTSRENQKLKMEIDRLQREKSALEERVLRQERLEKLLAYQQQQVGKFLVASLVGRDATQWSKMVFIDKGTQDGVREKLAVMTNAGIIGQVIQASATTSKVLLITDGRSAVDSIFQGTRVSGVVVGMGQEVCHIKFVPVTAEVKVGDRVLSSGLGGIFPKGFMVGTVAQVEKKKQELFQEITLVPSANLSHLEEVLVILP